MTKDNCNNCYNFILYPYSTTCLECGGSPKNCKHITNADKLRAMSDEELAEWLAKHNERSAVCPNFGAHDCQALCRQCWLDWLRQEAIE